MIDVISLGWAALMMVFSMSLALLFGEETVFNNINKRKNYARRNFNSRSNMFCYYYFWVSTRICIFTSSSKHLN